MSDEEALVPIEIEVRADQFDQIEEIVLSTGLSQSEVVRGLLDLGLTQARQADGEGQS